MEIQKNFDIRTLAVMTFYIVLSILGVYNATFFLLFPIVNLPMIYCTLKYNWSGIKVQVMSYIVVITMLFFPSPTLGTLMFILFVMLLTLMIKYYTSKHYPVVTMILYIGVLLTGLFYILLAYLYYLVGVDYSSIYLQTMSEYQTLMLEQIDYMATLNPQLIEHATQLKQTFMFQIELMKVLYPALTFIMITGLVAINVVCIRILTKVKKVDFPSLREIARTKFSRKLFALLVLGLIAIQLDNGMAFMMGANLVFLTTGLLQVIGFVTFIVLIMRGNSSSFVKFTFIVAGVMLAVAVPFGVLVLLVIGVFDTMMNLRKADLIV